MKKIFAIVLLFFLCNRLLAQDCSGFSFLCSVSESRCVATGSIMVTATGGSGNYNYQAIGPVSPPVTSSNSITGLMPGYYTIIVKDLTTGCEKQQDSIQVTGTYNDPRFQLEKTNVTCLGNDGSISVINEQFGRSPFSYTIVSPSPSNIGQTNTTGNFTGLIPGEYAIQLQDSCGGIQVRRITIENYNWWFDFVTVDRVGCDMADVFIQLEDNLGNVNTTPGTFAGFNYGFVLNGDTTWYPNNQFSVTIGTNRSLTLLAKDSCGTIHSDTWVLPENQKPSLGNISMTNIACETFTASISGQNLTNPNFCLYDSTNTLISCNTAGVFDSLPYASYCIQMTDACYDTTITKCIVATHPLPSVATEVSINNMQCSTFSATITGQQNLTLPQYCLFDSNNVQLQCDSTGVFDDLPYGSYCIKVHDGCIDTTITKCFTVSKPVAQLTGYSFSNVTCSSVSVHISGDSLINPQFCLYDSLGNVVACDSTGVFDELAHGSYCVKAISCGDTTSSLCFTTQKPVPSVDNGVQIIERKCSTFSVSITGQANLTTPEYCLYDSNDSLLSCDSTGVFYDIPYGSYCIKIHNSCYDTTITRCFSESHLIPSIDGTMEVIASNCSTVSFKVNGNNLTDPQYCLYDASNNLLTCNTTGTFSNYPYGQYCVTIHDGCTDTTMQVCQTFAPSRGITLTTSKSCTIGSSYVDVHFANSNSPYSIKIYHPDGRLVYSTTTSSNPFRIELGSLPTGTQYKIVGTDNCGNIDSSNITPDANLVSKSTTVRAKCPSATWSNGSGDIIASFTTNYYSLLPKIIKKDGTSFTRSYSSFSGNAYTFSDLEPAVYIVQYTQDNCNGKLYDTVTVSPYTYPSQGQSAIYQCDNNGFSLGADVKGGVSPYNFQIIGSIPDTPNITTSLQTSPIFSINNGTTYSLIRLRTIDACGNATLSDVSILPLQNISVRASDSCFYKSITLSVDTVANATYYWYKKRGAADSTLLDSGLTYNLPFFIPEQAGDYECKMTVNDGCVTRFANFSLTGNCYFGVLQTGIQLKGRKADDANELTWNSSNEKNITEYIVERKLSNENRFNPIGIVKANETKFYDNRPLDGMNLYRLKVVYNNKIEYSNTVSIASQTNAITVYPNPVLHQWNVVISNNKPMNYKMELIDISGKLVFSFETKAAANSTFNFSRKEEWKPGMYLLRIINQSSGAVEIRKLVLQ